MEKTGFFNEFNSSGKEINIEEGYLNKSSEFVILTVSGNIDTYNSTIFYKTITKFLSLIPRKIFVINMGGISYMSSTGIGVFVELLKYSKSNNMVMYLMNIQQNVSEVFSLLGFNTFFNFIDELKDINDEKIQLSLFPVTAQCPHCSVSLLIPKIGAFRCKSCSGLVRIMVVHDKVIIEQRGEQ